VEENHKSLLQEEGFVVIQAVINDIFEEELGFRVFRSMETDTAPPPRRNDALLLGDMRAARSTSMRFTEPQGHTKEQPAPPRRSTRSTAPPPYTPIYSSYGFIILSSSEEERLSRLEKRLVPNIEFDDQALYTLGFGTDIYYMLGHLGWVQFSNGVSADTHKGFVLEILMTIAPILDDGVQSLSFLWRESNKWFPTSMLGSYLDSIRELQRKVTCHPAC
jgi:hypothetical protein